MKQARPTFYHLVRERHTGIDFNILAGKASRVQYKERVKVTIDHVYHMATGIPVPRKVAEQVIEALSEMTDMVYSLNTVEVVLEEEQPDGG